MIALLLAAAAALTANELCDLAPWCACKLVRWSAFRRYTDPVRAETRAEELAAIIDERPGNLLKLITAAYFAGAGAMTAVRRALSRRTGHTRERAGASIDLPISQPAHGENRGTRRVLRRPPMVIVRVMPQAAMLIVRAMPEAVMLTWLVMIDIVREPLQRKSRASRATWPRAARYPATTPRQERRRRARAQRDWSREIETISATSSLRLYPPPEASTRPRPRDGAAGQGGASTTPMPAALAGPYW